MTIKTANLGMTVRVVKCYHGTKRHIGCVGTIKDINAATGELKVHFLKPEPSSGDDNCFASIVELVNQKPMNKMHFGIKFEESTDPVEFFETEKEAKKRIEELLDSSSVNKQSIYLFEIGKMYTVKRPINFDLVQI
jgi:hypothetical protein